MPKSRIAHKRTSTSGLLPNTTNSSNAAYIAAGELAVNLTDRKIVSSTGALPFEVGANLTSLYVGAGEITANATHLKLGTAALFANGSNGTTGQVLTSNGTSAYWATGGGGGSPAGSTTEVQFNDGGAFGANNRFTFDKTNTILTVGNSSMNTEIRSTNVVVGNGLANISMFYEADNKTGIFLLTEDSTYVYIVNDSQNDISLKAGNSEYFADYGNKEIKLTSWIGAPTDNILVANPDIITLGNTSVSTQINSTSIAVKALFANSSNGTSGQVLTSNGTGTYWAGVTGGSTTQIQFNDAGALAGSANLTFDKTTALVTIGNTTVNAQFFGNTGDIRFNQITTTALTLTANSLGFRGCPHNEQSGTTYTFTIHDAGKAVINTRTTGSTTWTLPNNASVPFPVGTMIMLDNSYYSSDVSTITLTGNSTGVGIRQTNGLQESNTQRLYAKAMTRQQIATIRKMANQGSTISVSSITRSTTTATLTATAHGFLVGDYIIVQGANQSQYNGLQRVITIATNTLTYIMVSDPGASATGTITVRRAEFWNISGSFGATNG